MHLRATRVLGSTMIVVALPLFAAARDVPLVDAVRQQNKPAIRALLRDKVDVNARKADGATALHWAAYRGDLQTADLLIRAGANVNAVNDLGVGPLYLACENGDASMVERLLAAGANPSAALPSGETALMTAARSGNLRAVTALLTRRADVNARERMDGQTALMWAASQRHPDVVGALIKAGADVKARSDVRNEMVSLGNVGGSGAPGASNISVKMPRGGYTPLLFASRVGDVQSATLLLAAGADVNDTGPDGATALMVAIHSGHTAFATLLLEQGADANAGTVGYAALHLAVLRSDLSVAKALLAHGARVNERTTRGTVVGRQAKYFVIYGSLAGATPFFLASKYADVPMMKALLAGGADATLGLPDGTTPLMVAAGARTNGFARGGRDRLDRDLDTAENELALSQDEDVRAVLSSGIGAVKLLVELGVDVNAANNAGDTALHNAAFHGFDSDIKFLVEHGAKIDVKNKAGRTPLTTAEGRVDADDKTIATTTAELLKTLASSR